MKAVGRGLSARSSLSHQAPIYPDILSDMFITGSCVQIAWRWRAGAGTGQETCPTPPLACSLPWSECNGSQGLLDVQSDASPRLTSGIMAYCCLIEHHHKKARPFPD